MPCDLSINLCRHGRLDRPTTSDRSVSIRAGTDVAYIGTHEGKLVAISLKNRNIAWIYQTEGSRRNGSTYTKTDGTPNYEAAYTDLFYDDLVVGATRMLSVGAILSSPAMADGAVYFGSADGSVYALN